MLESKINTSKNTNEYPSLKTIDSGLIILFKGLGIGTVVGYTEEADSDIKNEYQLGYFSTTWSLESLQDFDGDVILYNSRKK